MSTVNVPICSNVSHACFMYQKYIYFLFSKAYLRGALVFQRNKNLDFSGFLT